MFNDIMKIIDPFNVTKYDVFSKSFVYDQESDDKISIQKWVGNDVKKENIKLTYNTFNELILDINYNDGDIESFIYQYEYIDYVKATLKGEYLYITVFLKKNSIATEVDILVEEEKYDYGYLTE